MSRRKTTDEFIKEIQLKYGEKFNYSFIEYKDAKTLIKLQCNNCNLFFNRTPDTFLRCGNCPHCTNGPLTKENFLFKSYKKYKNRYDYSLMNFVDGKTKIQIKCNICNSILHHTPVNHLCRGGCSICAYNEKKLTTNEFIKKSNIIHENIYKYSKTHYTKSSKNIIITCPKHGDFIQTPNNHLDGHGCPKCHKRISKSETKFLDYLNIKNRQCYINKFYFDGYDDKTNTVYEFLGDFWHGNPEKYNKIDTNKLTKKTFGELYKNTINRFKKIINSGFKLKYIWENDWNNYQLGVVKNPKIKEYIHEGKK